LGGRVEITMTVGSTLTVEMAVGDAHPLGARPFARADYVAKFRTLSAGSLESEEIERFLETAQRLPSLDADELAGLSFSAHVGLLSSVPSPRGLF
jgi:2-methylcitrate dehydratase